MAIIFSCSVESSEIDLSEFQEDNQDESPTENRENNSDPGETNAETTSEPPSGPVGEAKYIIFFIHSVAFLTCKENCFTLILLFTENGSGTPSKQGKKLVISDEYFQRVTRALVLGLRQHEETVMQEGM